MTGPLPFSLKALDPVINDSRKNVTMFSRSILCLSAACILIMVTPPMAISQAKFSTIRSVHFDVNYIQGVPEAKAQKVLNFLLSEYDTLRSRLVLELKKKLEVRVYDSPGRFSSDINMGREVLPAMYVHGILYVLEPVPPEGLEKAMRYQLSRVVLEQTAQRACPVWLRESFAIHHSGRMADLSAPGSVTVASFSDLSQDLEDAQTPAERADVDYVLGRTMQFFIERHGQAKAFGVFREFDGILTVDKVFKKAFGEEYQDIEKAWSKYVAVKPRKTK